MSGVTIDETDFYKSVYGIDLGFSKAPIEDTGRQALDAIVQAGTPGTFLVDTLPWCETHDVLVSVQPSRLYVVRYWPEWLWGGGFMKQAIQWRKEVKDFKDMPFEEALTALVCIG